MCHIFLLIQAKKAEALHVKVGQYITSIYNANIGILNNTGFVDIFQLQIVDLLKNVKLILWLYFH